MQATRPFIILVLVWLHCVFSIESKPKIYRRNDSSNTFIKQSPQDYASIDLPATITSVLPVNAGELHNLASANPLLATLLLSYNLHIWPKSPGFNHPQHLPTNPYVALLLSHYGRYVPVSSSVAPSNSEQSSNGIRGIYGYTAANNYHNNLPFGSYKIYADNRDFR